ncbi:MAG TPA: ABC transporter permease [Burkholderiaceae bacterium]|nr:ABC transporter permease [Burkholderiaceae bacterium]
MVRWLNQHRYALGVAFRRLRNQPFSSLCNILVISLSLAVPIVVAAVLDTAKPVISQLPVSAEVTLYLDRAAPPEAARQISADLQQQHAEDIESLEVITRQQALELLRSRPAWSDALAVLPDNPLPDAIVVTLRQHPEIAQTTNRLSQQWRQLDSVDTVQVDSAWVQRLQALLDFLGMGLWMLALGVAVVVLATVFNTVRLQALTQREEIAIARLVGATESFVRRPFLYLGALTGLFSSALAVVIAWGALQPLGTAINRLASSYGTELALHLPDGVSLILAGIVVAILGSLSARWSVYRNTHF